MKELARDAAYVGLCVAVGCAVGVVGGIAGAIRCMKDALAEQDPEVAQR